MNNINYSSHGKPYTHKHPPPQQCGYKKLATSIVNVWVWWFAFIRPLLIISNILNLNGGTDGRLYRF